MTCNAGNRRVFKLLFIGLLFCNFSCNSSGGNKIGSGDDEDSYSGSGDFLDGVYCAEVDYYNPSTGTNSSYDLDVEVEDGELTVIYWPNGGWMDNSHFTPEDISDGECEFTSDKGYHYTVRLGNPGGCGQVDQNISRDNPEDEDEETTCPKCGDDKEEYDKYCYSCKRKIEDEEENTCSRCGSYEYGVYGGICSSCKSEDEDKDEDENEEY